MQNYLTLTDLRDWPDDAILVQVGGGPGCIVREPHNRTMPEIWTSFEEAVELAETFKSQKPWLKQIMIFAYDKAG